jgi:glycosyltransferase involved in cell wall biosynthesis
MNGPPGAAVTVVIPVWDNYVEFLGDAVESVRRYAPQAPVVVVDNASSRPLPELEGCEVVHSPRRLSAGAARNLGLERVATDYVVFLDADDMLLEGTLEFLHGRIAAIASLAMCTCSILDGATGERFRAPRRFVPRLARRPRTFALADSIWTMLPIQGCAIMRTAQVREAGGYAEGDAGRGEDWALAVSLAWRGRVEVSERLGLYYRPPGGPLRRGRGRTPAELRASTSRVRERMRRDPAVPGWARLTLPVIALLHLAAIYLARPVYMAVRRLRYGRSDIR